VANGWSVISKRGGEFGLHLPPALAGPPIVYQAGHFVSTQGIVNLPAIIIVTIVTAVLVKAFRRARASTRRCRSGRRVWAALLPPRG